MRLLTAALLVAGHACAAVVQGVVLDEESGNPLARTLVTLTPLPGTSAGAVSLRAGERGAFTILSVRPGWYILKTSRRGFADTEAGQLRPGRPGLPFEIAPDTQATFVQVRMRRLAAATGAVLDENGVGIPDWPVHLYTADKPVRRVAEGKTDERGNFRLGGLEAGRYVIRSGAGALEDGAGLLATYYKYGTALETAERMRLRLGETQSDVTIRPARGRLLEISGTLGPPYFPDTPVQLTLITDTGRRVIATRPGDFQATAIPPGPIELVVEGVQCGSYARLLLEKDAAALRPACLRLEPTQVDWREQENPGRAMAGRVLLGRRADLDGTGPSRLLKEREALPPGHWELQTEPTEELYVTSIRAQMGGETAARGDGWFGVYLSNRARLVVTMSSRPGVLSGVVMSGGKPVAGGAVYVESFQADEPERRLQGWTVRTDAAGRYRLGGLAPGQYRILSSFDFDPEDSGAMQKAAVVSLKEGETVVKALEMLFL